MPPQPSPHAVKAVMRETGMGELQAYRHLQQRMILQAAPTRSRIRISSDDAWPLRCADGRTFAERNGR